MIGLGIGRGEGRKGKKQNKTWCRPSIVSCRAETFSRSTFCGQGKPLASSERLTLAPRSLFPDSPTMLRADPWHYRVEDLDNLRGIFGRLRPSQSRRYLPPGAPNRRLATYTPTNRRGNPNRAVLCFACWAEMLECLNAAASIASGHPIVIRTSLGYHACHARPCQLALNWGIVALIFCAVGNFRGGYLRWLGLCFNDCRVARDHRSCCGLRSTFCSRVTSLAAGPVDCLLSGTASFRNPYSALSKTPRRQRRDSCNYRQVLCTTEA